MTRRTLLLPCWLMVCLALHASGQTPSPREADSEFELERVSWVGRAADGRAVTVLNHFGDVRARFGGYEGRVELLANVQHFAGEGPRLVVEAQETQAGVEVTVGYRSEGVLITRRNPDQKKRADLAVYVPKNSLLSASTDHGLIDLRGLESDVDASTVSGDITARKIAGEVRAETDGGAIQMLLEGWKAERRHRFASSTGDVTLVLAGDASAVVEIATSGWVSTDYSMEIDFEAERQPTRLGRAEIGKGSSEVSISSATGHVRLVRRPLARKARVRPGGRR